jgi:hypothetical protein
MMGARPMPLGQDVCIFRVESAAPYGWVVYCEGSRKTHFFGSESLAVLCARLWARATAPSRLDVKDLSGRVTQQWVFGDEGSTPVHDLGRAPDA